MDTLNKASQNVKANRASSEYGSGTQHTAHQRIMAFIRRSGFHASEGTQDRFGIGKDQRGLTYSPMRGSPDHELAHALMTPVGEGLREHQRKLGQVTTPKDGTGMTEQQARAEEGATFLMQPQIARRAGVKPIDTRHIGGFHGNPEKAPLQARGVGELDAFAEGRKTVDKKGNMIPGTSPDAKINARALGKAEGGNRWMGRFIVDPEHKHELDREAGLLWLQGMDPREAEAHAYEGYKKKRHAEAAAHHLAGQRAAQGSNDHEQAMKHGTLYALHVKAMGGNPHSSVPPEVKALVDQMEQPKLYRFKPHMGDAFVLDEQRVAKMEQALEKGTLLQFPTAEAQATPPSGDGTPAKVRVLPRQPQFQPGHRVMVPSLDEMPYGATEADFGARTGTVTRHHSTQGHHHYYVVRWDGGKENVMREQLLQPHQ